MRDDKSTRVLRRGMAAAVVASANPGLPTLWQRFGEITHADTSDLVRLGYLHVARMARAEIYGAGMHTRSGTQFRWSSAVFSEIAQNREERASVWWRTEATESHRTHFRDSCDHLYQRVIDRVMVDLLRIIPDATLLTALRAASSNSLRK